MKCNCEGCKHEIEICYDYQMKGYDAGLEFEKCGQEIHCFVFVINKNGKFIIK